MQIRFVALVFCLIPALLSAQSISEKRIRKHVAYLASDKLKGRGTGSPEEAMAAEYLVKHFKKAGLQPRGDNGTWYYSFTHKKASDPHGINHDGDQINAKNVVAYLDNGAAHTIIIGAHYDHLGLGHDHNSLEANPEGKIHNGADDNASGTSGVLELARYFAKNKVKEQHNFLFICFSGEELGLIGSKKYAEKPTIDLKTVSFMLNMDMIGRLNAELTLVIGGVGTAPDFVPLVRATPTTLKIKQDSVGQGPSDHTSFYLQNIPVLFAFTGQHSDYHKPSDDANLVNYAGEVEVLNYLIRLIEGLDKQPKLTFQATKAPQSSNVRLKATLGIMPDYTFDGNGLRIDGVTDGKPASKAGLQKGDIILQLGGTDIQSVQGYMEVLSKFDKGATTTVKVKRGDVEQTMQVTF
jgi:Peptidase family M28/PDZ domain